eukprot:4488567-Alexandrium_andersonii.AAC.1
MHSAPFFVQRPNLQAKPAGGRAGGASRGVVRGGGAPPGSPALRRWISVEPNRSTEPNTTETEPTEP